MTSKEKLVSKDIYLRPLSLKDVTCEYVDWMSDNEVIKYLEVRHTKQTLSVIESFIAAKLSRNDEFIFAICDKKTDKHIGNIKLGPIHHYYKKADLSLFIGDKNYWGKNLAYQAIQLMIVFAFEKLELTKLLATFYLDNQSSMKAFKKAGFQKEGLSPDYLTLNGNPHDLVWMGISSRQYNSGIKIA